MLDAVLDGFESIGEGYASISKGMASFGNAFDVRGRRRKRPRRAPQDAPQRDAGTAQASAQDTQR